jgi:hypothetical protein
MFLETVAGGFCAFATAVHLASILIAARRCRRPGLKEAALPAVSLLRPVCGTENFLAENLFELWLDYSRLRDPVLRRTAGRSGGADRARPD